MPSSLAANSKSQNLERTKEKLRALAAAGAPPQILEVLRSLRPYLIECVDRKIRPGRILSTLQEEGWPFSRAGFYLAWGRFLEENGYRPSHRETFLQKRFPRGPIDLSPAKPSPKPRPEPSSEALDVLARPSVTQLLAQNGL